MSLFKGFIVAAIVGVVCFATLWGMIIYFTASMMCVNGVKVPGMCA